MRPKQRISVHPSIICTLLSWPALASNFPSEEKWQHVILLFLVLIQPTSPKVKPALENNMAGLRMQKITRTYHIERKCHSITLRRLFLTLRRALLCCSINITSISALMWQKRFHVIIQRPNISKTFHIFLQKEITFPYILSSLLKIFSNSESDSKEHGLQTYTSRVCSLKSLKMQT